MNSETQSEQPVPAPEAPGYSVPWKFMDNWIGVGLLVLIDVVLFIVLRDSRIEFAQSAVIVLLEAAYVLPLAIVFAWRRIHWKHLGFGKFEWKTLGLGCGLLIVSYSVIFLHNALLYFFGVDTQGQDVMNLLAKLDSPIWFFIVAAVVAPFVEEIFFRGFLFQGLREKYGWLSAMLISSAIFAAAHLDLVVLIPTFILGNLLAYMYHRSNSVWPGIILHFLVNASSSCAAYFLILYPDLIPS